MSTDNKGSLLQEMKLAFLEKVQLGQANNSTQSQKYNQKGTLAYRFNQYKKPLIGVGVVCLVTVISFVSCNKSDNNSIALTGKESISTNTQSETIYNEEQAKFAHAKALESGATNGLNIDLATKRIIKQGRFSLDELKANPDRFKVIRIKDGQDIFVDIVTNETYDLQGNLVDYDYKPPYVEQVQVDYSDNGGLIANSTPPTVTQPINATVTSSDISPRLQSQVDLLNANNTANYDRMTSIYETSHSNNARYQESIAQAHDDYQNKMQAKQAMVGQQINQVLNKLGAVSAFNPTIHKLQYNSNGFGATVFKSDKTSQSTDDKSLDTRYETPYLAPSVLRQGTHLLVLISTEVNTDKSTMVWGQVLDGVYSGAKISGTIIPKQDDIGIVFTHVYPKNTRLPVVNLSAVAVSLDNYHDGVSTDIDKHYLENYTGLIAKSALQGYGNAYANSTTTTQINRSDGTVIVTKDGKVNHDEIRGQIVAELAGKLNAQTQQWGNRPPTYRIKRGTLVYAQLLSDLDTKLDSKHKE